MIAVGVAAELTGASIADADEQWAAFAGRLVHDFEGPDVWGVGPLAMASFPFDSAHTTAQSRLIVPRMIVGRRDARAWLTVVSEEPDPDMAVPAPQATSPSPRVIATQPWGLAADDWARAVEQARAKVASGALSKVVLARGQTMTCDDAIDLRSCARLLAQTYDNTWMYLLDGLVGASPEMLVRRQRGLATSRVLAGTIPRHGDEREDLRLAASLARSGKNLIEHELAVESVASALAPVCSGMNVPDAPYVLQLPNVFHLASDVTGVCQQAVTSLSLVERLHPSAAVCGTPTAAARQAITEIEHMDRGRYAGPVGWIDTHGDGEWAIALRCGETVPADPTRIHLYAGAGIVAESDPHEELAETSYKLEPMRTALGLPFPARA